MRDDTLRATINLVLATAGAGILSFPFAIMKVGVYIGPILCVVFGILNLYSQLVLIRQCSYDSQGYVYSSYYKLVNYRLGSYYGAVAFGTIYLGIFGCLIGFLIIIADLCCPSMKQLFSDDSIFASRPFVILVFVFFIAAPLSAVPKLESLFISSLFGVLSIVFVVISVVYKMSINGNIDKSIEALPMSWWSIFESMPIMLFAFGCPLQIVTAYFEMKHTHQLHKNNETKVIITMNQAALNTIIICSLMYCSVGKNYTSFTCICLSP